MNAAGLQRVSPELTSCADDDATVFRDRNIERIDAVVTCSDSCRPMDSDRGCDEPRRQGVPDEVDARELSAGVECG